MINIFVFKQKKKSVFFSSNMKFIKSILLRAQDLVIDDDDILIATSDRFYICNFEKGVNSWELVFDYNYEIYRKKAVNKTKFSWLKCSLITILYFLMREN